MNFDHIGIVVSQLDQGRQHLTELFDIERWTREFHDPINGVRVQFGIDRSGICYEAVSPIGSNSPVSAALNSGTRILNHVAYLVPSLPVAAARMTASRCRPAGKAQPAVAYGGNQIQFFISPIRMIIELIEAPHHTHQYFAR
jgi:methylmalonyl-CoA/ethylmalonyl-CoA epimerase